MPESKTSPRRIVAVFKQQRAIELRMAGLTYDEIAKKLGYASRAGACMAVQAGLHKTLQEPRERYQALNTERLNKIIKVWWPRLLRRDDKASDQIMKAIKQIRELQGLDAPVQHELSGPAGGPVAIDHSIQSALVDQMTDEEVLIAIAQAEAIVRGR